MKKIALLFLFVLGTTLLNAQDSSIIWQKTIGGNDNDVLFKTIQTSDNGYLLGGTSSSNISGDKTENSQGLADFWVIKFDASGEIVWQKTIGGDNDDFLYTLKETSDGGYIIGGLSRSGISGDKTEANIGGADYWVVKLSNLGDIIWQNTIGGNGDDVFTSIELSNDGGYLLSGYSSSNISGDKTDNSKGFSDYWIVKIDPSGNIEWDETIGGNNQDLASSLISTNDGGYLIGGISFSGISGDKTEPNLGLSDFWVVKINSQGTVEWDNTIGGDGNDILNSVNKTSDNGFIIGGNSESGKSIDKTEDLIGIRDYWVIKLNNSGIIEWDNTIGGTGSDSVWSVSQTLDNGYIIGGQSDSNVSGDKTENTNGEADFWIVKLTNTGIIDSQVTIGGDGIDLLRSIQQTNDGGFIIGGGSLSNISGDKTEDSRGLNDYWLIKLGGSLGVIENLNTLSFLMYPNPTKDNLQLSAKDITVDAVKIFSIKGELIKTIEGFSGTTTVDVSQLSAGVYFLQIAADSKIVTKKFVKE